MTEEGPAGGPRPFAESQLTIEVTDDDVDVDFDIVGPAGVTRPLAKLNPVTDEEIQQCMDSRGAQNFISGIEERFDIDISPRQEERLKREWCTGFLSGIQSLEE